MAPICSETRVDELQGLYIGVIRETQKGHHEKAHLCCVAGSNIGPQSACPKNSEKTKTSKVWGPKYNTRVEIHSSSMRFGV